MADDLIERTPSRRRPRVLRIITRLAVGGVSTHVTLANQGLARRGWETLLIHGRVQPDELEIDLQIPDVAMHRIDTLARPIDPIADLRTAGSLLRVIRLIPPGHHPHASLKGRTRRPVGGDARRRYRASIRSTATSSRAISDVGRRRGS